MIFKQYFLSCLSHASYLVGDERSGVAAVVDPQRDISGYLEDAGRHGLKVTTVIETHFHADFLSGHLELAAATGAEICYGKGASADFPIRLLEDGERLELGDVMLEIHSTPGHTLESISVVVYEHDGDEVPFGVLTGDTLFIGDVGRPDLMAGQGVTAEELAGLLFDSVQRLLTLPDETRVYPAHGAGSACGKNLSTDTWSTMGEQRRTNYALRIASKEEFVATITAGQPSAPPYFPYDAQLNRERRQLLDDHAPPAALTLEQLLASQEAGAVVLDTREPSEFARGHFLGSLNVGLGGRFAECAGDVLRPADEIVLVCDPGHATEARVRLGRIGFDHVIGYLMGEVAEALERAPGGPRRGRLVQPAELARSLGESGKAPCCIVDVRNPAELEAGQIPGARNIPLPELVARLDEIPFDEPVLVHCASGYRSSIAASVIRRAGHGDVSDLAGGYQAFERALARDRLGGGPPG